MMVDISVNGSYLSQEEAERIELALEEYLESLRAEQEKVRQQQVVLAHQNECLNSSIDKTNRLIVRLRGG